MTWWRGLTLWLLLYVAKIGGPGQMACLGARGPPDPALYDTKYREYGELLFSSIFETIIQFNFYKIKLFCFSMFCKGPGPPLDPSLQVAKHVLHLSLQ